MALQHVGSWKFLLEILKIQELKKFDVTITPFALVGYEIGYN